MREKRAKQEINYDPASKLSFQKLNDESIIQRRVVAIRRAIAKRPEAEQQNKWRVDKYNLLGEAFVDVSTDEDEDGRDAGLHDEEAARAAATAARALATWRWPKPPSRPR